MDVFKNYVMSGKFETEASENKLPTILPNMVLKADDLAGVGEPNSNLKPQKKSLFKRLFQRLRRRRFHNEISNDTLTSMNTEFNRW